MQAWRTCTTVSQIYKHSSVADLDDFLPDLDPGLIKFLAKFLLEILLVEICCKNYIHGLKS
jgi:hypothetical protein